MIPRKLELKNFLSYGEPLQTIDLSPYGMICLSGRNGNGKSALLDAITWAIWGQARKTSGISKADEGLLHLGKTRMLVSLEWEIGNKVYRVRREYAKTYGKPYAALDFELFDAASNRFISLTDKTIRQTQDAIDAAVGLDFDTFINSAFIKQGQSNEFSKKTPKERKAILGAILGLDRYDALQQAALSKARTFETQKQSLQQIIAHFDQELATRDPLSAQLVVHDQELAAITEKLKQTDSAIAHLQQQQQVYDAQQARMSVLNKQAETLQTAQHEKKQYLSELIKEWRTTHAASRTLVAPSDLAAQRNSLTLQEEHFRTLTDELLTLETTLRTMQQQLHHAEVSARNTVQEKLQQTQLAYDNAQHTYIQAQAQLEHINKALQRCTDDEQSLTTRIALLTAERAGFEQHTTTLTAAQKQFEKRKQYYQLLIQRGNLHAQQLKDLTSKNALAHDHNNPACPLCEQLLTAQRKKFLMQQFAKQETHIQHRLARITRTIQALKEILIEQHKHIESANQRLDQYKQQEALMRELITNKELIEKNRQALLQEQTHQQRLTSELELVTNKATAAKTAAQAALNTAITTDNTCIQLRKQLNDVEEHKKKLHELLQPYAAIRTQLQALDTAILAQAHHSASLEQQPLRKKTIAQLIADIRIQREQLTHIENEQKLFLQTQQLFIEHAHTLTRMREEQAALIQSKETTLLAQAACKQQLTRLTSIEHNKSEKQKQLESIQQEITSFQALATAFSKNGIQALLIEEAIPEIEQEANALLGQLTDNQAQLFIESLRDLKSGGVRETLDIKIADTAGIRPYEMFSGGEAFRIDFALRIAIAKLLARRAGTALQTLIIDEGFGALDEDGLSRIMNALYAIQKDFAKIIIVSHLTEFKENFPVHFLVEKTATGSHITIEERG